MSNIQCTGVSEGGKIQGVFSALNIFFFFSQSQQFSVIPSFLGKFSSPWWGFCFWPGQGGVIT